MMMTFFEDSAAVLATEQLQAGYRKAFDAYFAGHPGQELREN